MKEKRWQISLKKNDKTLRQLLMGLKKEESETERDRERENNAGNLYGNIGNKI